METRLVLRQNQNRLFSRHRIIEHLLIQRIELVNFMSHEHSVIDLAEGLTVLVGPNNCGKSAIVAALQVLCYNDNSTYVMRHESRECSITIETDDGHIVRWSRKKNGSPRYEIDGKPFDRLRGGQPAELHKILQLPRVAAAGRQFDVHFGTQRSPVFLLDEPGSAAADFFASSSDAIRLVEMQSLHKQNVTEQNRERKRLASERANTESMLESLKPLVSVMTDLDEIEKQHRELIAVQSRMESIHKTMLGLASRFGELAMFSRQLEGFAGLTTPPALAETRVLETLAGSMATTRETLTAATTRVSALSELQPPPSVISTIELQRVVDDIDRNQNRLKQSLVGKQALESLAEPPVLTDCALLEQSLIGIVKWQALLEKLEGESRALKFLTQLEIDDSRPRLLAQQIEAAELKAKTVATRELELKANKNALLEVRTQIAQWVDANPLCPTCGSEITPEQVIAGQEHLHDS